MDQMRSVNLPEAGPLTLHRRGHWFEPITTHHSTYRTHQQYKYRTTTAHKIDRTSVLMCHASFRFCPPELQLTLNNYT